MSLNASLFSHPVEVALNIQQSVLWIQNYRNISAGLGRVNVIFKTQFSRYEFKMPFVFSNDKEFKLYAFN
jgi:hypothetical protein